MNRRLRTFIGLVIGASMLLSGCATLNSVQRAELKAMKASDAGVYVEEKMPPRSDSC